MPARQKKDTDGYLGSEPELLREQIDRLKAALEDLARSQGAEATKAIDESLRDLLARASALAEELAQHAEKTRTLAAEGRHRLEDAVRAQPLLAIGLAALGGFLLASLRRR